MKIPIEVTCTAWFQGGVIFAGQALASGLMEADTVVSCLRSFMVTGPLPGRPKEIAGVINSVAQNFVYQGQPEIAQVLRSALVVNDGQHGTSVN
jgi:hypothetical protein